MAKSELKELLGLDERGGGGGSASSTTDNPPKKRVKKEANTGIPDIGDEQRWSLDTLWDCSQEYDEQHSVDLFRRNANS